ncbi:MAG: hypothetical protein KTR18_06920 [Acidiferrobacterales bacterium]|nr:hypothetical protein [Acidiferrobacterales bacterium]
MIPRKIRETIEVAFDRVELGEGIGLWQAQAIDDYASKEDILKARLRDEKTDWRKLKGKELIRCHSSLSFFDADGMRFHLPAFMLSEEFRENMDGLLFHLTHLNDYVRSMYTSLSISQRAAVRKYLLWCQNQEEYEFEKDMIEKSLNEYWIDAID